MLCRGIFQSKAEYMIGIHDTLLLGDTMANLAFIGTIYDVWNNLTHFSDHICLHKWWSTIFINVLMNGLLLHLCGPILSFCLQNFFLATSKMTQGKTCHANLMTWVQILEPCKEKKQIISYTKLFSEPPHDMYTVPSVSTGIHYTYTQ